MRLPFFRSLYGRIFAIFWLTLCLVLISVLFIKHSDPRNTQDAPASTQREAKELAKLVTDRLEKRGPMPVKQRLQQFSGRYGIKNDRQLFFVRGESELIHHKQQPRPFNRAVRNFITIADDPLKPLQKPYGPWLLSGPYIIESPQDNVPIWLYLGQGGNQTENLIVSILDSPMQFLLAAMAISTPFLIWLAWALSKPARKLQKAAKRVADGHFDGDPDLEKGTQEFREAGASFNQMVKAINGMMSSQQRLLSDISHELRSPLTRLRMANAVAMRKQGQSSELQRIDTEAERLEGMISDLLSLSRMQMDSHVSHSVFTPEELWGEMLDDARFEAEQSQKSATVSTLPDVQIEAYGPMLCSALENVVRNAIRYGDKAVDVKFSTSSEELTIEVTDDGGGIPEGELEDIFRPFYRVSSSRTRRTGGTGLGLAITDNAIRQHNGRCFAKNVPGSGLSVTLVIPLHKP
ncbi:two-component system sensor histidine kinase CpxA [Veronia nyctiphanis]|uniref:histidine kinase n=1 Tax=Veronia nyctiphanis TaxID=1278244 RepID=A0A4Q0YQR8_9GAMM|nr:envelope stress sensor histidine kinase CpxA [Veronia nyctiphanis]RXJ73487.1 two-component system sensor histidine kinase CpxA [Veronia nyctiphanis]